MADFDLELRVDARTQNELCLCAGMAQSLVLLLSARSTESTELAEAMAKELAERMWAVYAESSDTGLDQVNKPDAQASHG